MACRPTLRFVGKCQQQPTKSDGDSANLAHMADLTSKNPHDYEDFDRMKASTA